MHIDEIVNIIAENKETSIQEIVQKTGLDNDEIMSVLRDAEEEGMVFRFKKEGQDIWKV
jgi:predicted transcriptional regulator